jgi:dihydropteroate synthase type 2
VEFTSHFPRIVGIVNLTDDSFSDGGLYLSPADARAHAARLLAAGADVIELGPAASHPSARTVPPDEEIRRLEAVLPELLKNGAVVSVDSFQPQTQRWCLRRGVHFLNDTAGFSDPGVYAELAAHTCKLVVVHSMLASGRGTRRAQDPSRALESIHAFFESRLRDLQTAGISADRLVIDPGTGFFLGGNPEPSILVLRRLRRLKEAFGLPLLISVSRKSFLGAITGRDLHERGPATLAAEIYCTLQGADYIRTHDVGALRDALRVITALGEPDPVPGGGR